MLNLVDAAATGVGVYSIPEAARYARMPAATLRNWFSGGTNRTPLRKGEIHCEEMKVITFLDFVEAIAIRSLRVDGVSFPRIREALRNARDKYGVQHPFAHRNHRTVVIGKDFHIFLGDDPVNPVQLTGRNTGQKSMRPCIQEYIRDLVFDEKGVAKLYNAFEFNGQKVVLNPKIHFGEPVIQENGYTTETLYRAAVAEGSIPRAAMLYKASEYAVEAAYRYHHELGIAA